MRACTILALLLCGISSLLTPAALRAEEVRVTQSHMGMAVTLRIDVEDEFARPAAQQAAKAAFERIGELNAILSDWEPDSELNRLCRRAGDGPVAISEELHTVLTASLRLAEQSDGLLDPTAAPVIRLWRTARRESRLPDPSDLADARRLVGYKHLKLTPGHAELTTAGMQLDLGSIAKGDIGDEAIRVLKAEGFGHAIFEAGGAVVAGNPPAGEAGWLVEPEGFQALRVANEAVAISGDSVQFTIIDGRRYGHIVDPRTGEPTESRRACLVRAPRGIEADPLATLGTLMPWDDFQKLVATAHPGVTVAGAEPAESDTVPPR